MDIQVLKLVNIIECILCIHRTISSSTFIFRTLRYLHVVWEFSLPLADGLHRHFFRDENEGVIVMVNFHLENIKSVAIVAFAAWKSKKYMQLLKYISINHSLIKTDPQYSRSLKRIFIVLITAVLGSIAIQIATLTMSRSYEFSNYENFIVAQLFFTNSVISRYRYTFEFLALFTILYVMTEQLSSITKSVDNFEVQEKGTKPEIEYHASLKMYDKWCTVYSNVKECSKLFNDVFGIQMTMMVSTIVIRYIVFLYSLTSISLMGNTNATVRCVFILTLGLLLINLMMLSMAAQRTENKAELLKRCLARLLIQSLTNEDYYKSTKDLLRLVSTRPIRTKAFGSINVDMTLLPTCVVFFTYYTVIALQFNNVV